MKVGSWFRFGRKPRSESGEAESVGSTGTSSSTVNSWRSAGATTSKTGVVQGFEAAADAAPATPPRPAPVLLELADTVSQQYVAATVEVNQLKAQLRQAKKEGSPHDVIEGALLAAEEAEKTAKGTFLELRQEVQSSLKSLSAQQAKLTNLLERVKENAPFVSLQDSRTRLADLNTDYTQASNDLTLAGQAWRVLDSVPVPGSALSRTSAAVGLTSSLNIVGVASAGVNGTLRSDAATHERRRRLVPTVAAGAGIQFGGVGYVLAPRDSGLTGPSIRFSPLPIISFGHTPEGKYVGINVPGLFGAGITEGGQLNGFFPVAFVPIVGPMMNVRVAHPALRAFTEPVVDALVDGLVATQERFARATEWFEDPGVTPPPVKAMPPARPADELLEQADLVNKAYRAAQSDVKKFKSMSGHGADQRGAESRERKAKAELLKLRQEIQSSLHSLREKYAAQQAKLGAGLDQVQKKAPFESLQDSRTRLNDLSNDYNTAVRNVALAEEALKMLDRAPAIEVSQVIGGARR